MQNVSQPSRGEKRIVRLLIVVAVGWMFYVSYSNVSDFLRAMKYPSSGRVVDPPGWMIQCVFIWKAQIKPYLRPFMELFVGLACAMALAGLLRNRSGFVRWSWTAIGVAVIFAGIDSASGIMLANSPRSKVPAGPVTQQFIGSIAPNRSIMVQSQRGRAGSWLMHTNKNLMEVAKMSAPLLLLLMGAIFSRGRAENECKRCGYSLSHLQSDRCPECGTALGPGSSRPPQLPSSPAH